MTLWVLFALMSLVAVGFAIWPLYRHKRSLSPLIGVAVVFVVALSSGLYFHQGNPELPSGGGAVPDMEEAVIALAERLANNSDDLDGWKMLGRSYMSLGNFSAAVTAFETAVEMESAQDSHTLVSLGEALLAHTSSPIDGRISALFENALALDPNNPQALFYGGIGAFNRNDQQLAADRWERLLALNPPDEIQGILQQRIAEWRGETVPLENDAVVTANVTISDDAIAALPAEATVYIIARDPAQPSPPIAVTRRRLSDLPGMVELGDRESMVPGRNLSAFAEFELIARVSISGQPSAQPGDWFGTMIVKPAEIDDVQIIIQQQVQ